MNVLTLFSVQVALEYAQKKYDDFAAIVQPFFSDAKSDNFTVDFLSTVSSITYSATQLYLYSQIAN